MLSRNERRRIRRLWQRGHRIKDICATVKRCKITVNRVITAAKKLPFRGKRTCQK